MNNFEFVVTLIHTKLHFGISKQCEKDIYLKKEILERKSGIFFEK